MGAATKREWSFKMVDYEHQGGSMQTILPLEVVKSKTKADSYHTPFVSSTVFDKYTQNCSLHFFLYSFLQSLFLCWKINKKYWSFNHPSIKMFLKIQIKRHNTKCDLWSLLRVLCIFLQNKAVLFKKEILFTQMVRESWEYTLRSFCLTSSEQSEAFLCCWSGGTNWDQPKQRGR